MSKKKSIGFPMLSGYSVLLQCQEPKVSSKLTEILQGKLRAIRSVPKIERQPPRTPGKPRDPAESESVPISGETIRGVKAKLGLVDMCFPEAGPVSGSLHELGLVEFPESYRRLSAKEKLVLLFAESFRRQYKEQFRHRKPPILALGNECGVQKFVCSTVKPAILQYSELIGSWQAIASFVADYVVFEPLQDQINMSASRVRIKVRIRKMSAKLEKTGKRISTNADLRRGVSAKQATNHDTAVLSKTVPP
ncbi:dynein regulatory complex subunit 7-like [Uranotaenia lowii]|uniref:dynein regulatory complex subunit 7-like n=1 Tax=Uranotaenia lowii TaxID=190385 RepID=UPI0024787526|nr:dynein regulatory complex subunit 7-like [Uranotaenia lowii]